MVSEEFVHRILKASPLTIKSSFNTWWVTRGEMCVLEGFHSFKCVSTSRIDSSLNLVPLYIIVSENTVSVLNISVVNLIVG